MFTEQFFHFLKNFLIVFSWKKQSKMSKISQKQSKMKTNVVIDISTPIPYLGVQLCALCFEFLLNLVSQLRLKFVSCERICSKGNIRNSLLPHTLKCPSTFNCWYCGCRMRWRYTLTLSLIPQFSVSKIYSSLHVSQITTYVRLKLSHVERFFNLKVI